jgi:cation diffusion facilitator CzcD-associated flavoprotein CzcO
MANVQEFEALVVGAGFCGLHILNKLRQNNFKVKLWEAGSGMGGTWYWNRYPGARVDSDSQIYQFTQDEVQGYPWPERFPDHNELRKYFAWVDSKLNFSKDIQFNTRVASAQFDDGRNQWLVTSEGGESVWARHLIMSTGSTTKRYTPEFKGLDTFKGQAYHTNRWPEDIDFNGKRVAVIGTGASGVQVIQEIGPVVSHLTVYQRTPNLALPMQQYGPGQEKQWHMGLSQKEIYDLVITTFGAFNADFVKKNALEVTPEERRAHYEDLYRLGGFYFWLATYHDVLLNKEANDTAYAFWLEKTRARLTDPVKREILAPSVPPHAFGTKRPCLEQRYWEVYNQPNVDLVDVNKSPIFEITPEGVKTQNEGVVPVDIIVLATGFDSMTGALLDVEIKNGQGLSLQEKWRGENGTTTYLGVTIGGFPNLYYTYGPHAPTAFTTSTKFFETQGEWIVNTLVALREQGKTRIEPTPVAEEKWTQEVREFWKNSLFPGTKSWYQGCNIPGKRVEALNYIGGVPRYIKALKDTANNNYEGFVIA